MESTRRFTTDEVSAIVRRALNGRDAAETVSHEELLETARELGIDPHRLEEAIEEQDALGEIEEAREAWRRRRKQHFVHGHLRSYLIVNGFLMVLDLLTSGGEWFYYPMLGWGIGLAFDAASAFFPSEQSVERGARKILRARGRLRESPRRHRNLSAMDLDHGRREERYSS
jgi:hypothetical protein